MILKSNTILYAFDFDGTIMGDNNWTNFWTSTKAALTKGPYINPNDEFDVRWIILTGRPKIDKPIIAYSCYSNGLYPTKIYTYPKWRHTYSNDDVINFKTNFLKDAINGKIGINNSNIEKAFYIDNDSVCVRQINSNRENYPFMAMTVLDFRKQEFNIFI